MTAENPTAASWAAEHAADPRHAPTIQPHHLPLPPQALRAAVWPHEARAAGERDGGAARVGGPCHLHPPCAAPRLRRLVPRGRQGLGGLGRQRECFEVLQSHVKPL